MGQAHVLFLGGRLLRPAAPRCALRVGGVCYGRRRGIAAGDGRRPRPPRFTRRRSARALVWHGVTGSVARRRERRRPQGAHPDGGTGGVLQPRRRGSDHRRRDVPARRALTNTTTKNLAEDLLAQHASWHEPQSGGCDDERQPPRAARSSASGGARMLANLYSKPYPRTATTPRAATYAT